MNLKHGWIRFGCTKQLNLLVVVGWVGLGPNFSTCSGLGWVGLSQSADGMGWIGSHKMDPWTTPVDIASCTIPYRLTCRLISLIARVNHVQRISSRRSRGVSRDPTPRIHYSLSGARALSRDGAGA